MNWRFWTWDFSRPKQNKVLLVMRASEMLVIHPETDWLHACKSCHEPVGIYPSGQNFLKTFGEENIDIICNHCGDPSGVPLAPGAFEEVGQSIRNPNL